MDESINTAQIIANVLIPEEVDALPDKEVLGIEWPVELLSQSEERVVLTAKAWGDLERPLFLVELAYRTTERSTGNGSILFDLFGTEEQSLASFALRVGGAEGYRVDQVVGDEVFIKAGVRSCSLAEYLTDYSPTVRFVDLCELEGNVLIRPQNPQELTIPDDRFEVWDWQGIDITQESMWKNGSERRDSIQWHAAQQYMKGQFDIVFDDDSAGEAADLVCLKEEHDHIRLALVHCKFSGGRTSGERVKDVVEVSSQAIRSAKWKWRFRDLIRHIVGRESRLYRPQRPSRFLVGRSADLNRFAKVSRFKEIRTEILIVQPGLSKSGRTAEQNTVLASAFSYLKETIGIDLDVICSS
ncbi:MAG: hypothetical protein FPO08_08100 [Geobacter sp.]|nr:MAG: hypothetical protein FPO08_08100 [Geobacter sp.]